MTRNPAGLQVAREMIADYLEQQWAPFLDRPLPRTEWLEEADEILDIVAVQSQLKGTRIRRDQVDVGGPCPRCEGGGRMLWLRNAQ